MSSGFWELQVGGVGSCLKTTFHFTEEEILKQSKGDNSENRLAGFELTAPPRGRAHEFLSAFQHFHKNFAGGFS